ncbi:baseplate J/gp47 family protein [Paenibacillus spongiae]|uniref:Baseplate J/gp47 family protein n=1 Tax=Paenibacillus spongiae TaxID=2909671 RepID=A0ABY5SHC7_9BACL|nr:baseplate J/gp47 family protein [Paenibacillus spongiae]UVI32095.1 baseplate J/gp47 family protein [Paenibacillus spongiae]
MFEDNTFEELLNNMLDEIQSGISKIEGTFTYDTLAAFATQLAIAYTQLDRVLTLGFADTATGEYLDKRANEFGLTRKVAVKATGQIKATGTNGTIIPQGTEFATLDETYFITTASGTITGGTATIQIEAVNAGSASNVASGTITEIPVSIIGLSSVSNDNATSGGSDIESDDELRIRLSDRVKKPATSGNANFYRNLALEIPGISEAKVIPIWYGSGTVKVILLDANKRAPIIDKVTEVANHIESERPIGATVTVVAATETPINISVDLTLSGGTLAEAKTVIEQGVTDYLRTLAFADPIVRYTKIANIIINTQNIQDYQSLMVNGGTGNIAIANDAVAVQGSVTVS